MITAATKQMLEAHCCCPLRHRGLLTPSWIFWPSFCRLSFSSHGNLHLSWQRSLVTKEASRKNGSPLKLLLWLPSGENSSDQNINRTVHSVRWCVCGQQVILFIMAVNFGDWLSSKQTKRQCVIYPVLFLSFEIALHSTEFQSFAAGLVTLTGLGIVRKMSVPVGIAIPWLSEWYFISIPISWNPF